MSNSVREELQSCMTTFLPNCNSTYLTSQKTTNYRIRDISSVLDETNDIAEGLIGATQTLGTLRALDKINVRAALIKAMSTHYAESS